MWQILPKDLKELLDPDERISWVGRPERAPFILRYLAILLFLIPFFIIPLPLFFDSFSLSLDIFFIVFLLFWYGILLIMASVPLKKALEWKNVLYVLTNKRAIVRKGFIGIDYDMLNLDLVKMVKIDVGFWDKIYGTGTVTLEAVGVDPVTMPSVRNPYDAEKVIRKIIEERNREEL